MHVYTIALPTIHKTTLPTTNKNLETNPVAAYWAVQECEEDSNDEEHVPSPINMVRGTVVVSLPVPETEFTGLKFKKLKLSNGGCQNPIRVQDHNYDQQDQCHGR